MNFSFLPLRRNTKNILGAILALVILYWVGYYFVGKPFVPDNFTGAREQGAGIAKEIVALAEQSIQNLDKIAVQDRQGNFYAASDLVKEELKRAQNSRLKAFGLTEQLGEMVRAAAGITPAKARNLALDAVAQELLLIKHLNTYNDILNGLLQTLGLKFKGIGDSKEVPALIKNMNQEEQEINNLNNSFNEKMRQFDELVK